MKQISFKLPRLDKRQIYVSYARSLLEYGDVIYDNCSDDLCYKIESVQRQFCITIIGTYKKQITFEKIGYNVQNPKNALHLNIYVIVVQGI